MNPSGWHGISSLKYLVIFGASYCDVGYNSKAPHPTAERPLGVDFPGTTFCGRVDEKANSFVFEPNWVGHLVELIKRRGNGSPLLVFDYALGGDRVDGVDRQVHRDFLPHLATKPDWAPWTPDDTLIMNWIGINDCSWNAQTPDPVASNEASVRKLFALQDELFQAGARNFLFIDVPPTYIFPGPVAKQSQKLKDAVLSWNSILRGAAEKFEDDHPGSTALVWSSWEFFTQLLGDPVSYGFHAEDAAMEEGGIFVDGLHPTSAVHRLIAQQLLEFLSSSDCGQDTTFDAGTIDA